MRVAMGVEVVGVYLFRTEIGQQRVWVMSDWSIGGFDGGTARLCAFRERAWKGSV